MPVGGGGGSVEPPTSNFADEKPVGGGSGHEMMQSSAAEADHSGTNAERQKSKNWLVRQKLYEEMTLAYNSASDPKAECFHDQCGNWKKYLQEENNPMGMESLLNCLAAYIDRCDPNLLAASQNDLVKTLIEKGFSHTKPTVRQKSSECFLSLFEVTEVFDEQTNDAILEMMKHKNAKISLTAIQTLILLLRAYGPKKVQLKAFIKSMEDAAGSTTPSVKTEGLNFFKECYRWMGDGPVIEALIKNLKSQQIDSLREEFIKIKAEGKKVPKLTRTEQKKAKDAELDGIIARQEEEEKGEDPGLDLFEAVNVLATYNSEWIEKFSAKKWQERKTDLEAMLEAFNQPKIKSGDFSGIVNVLKDQLKDSMMQVSQPAIKVCAILAEKLKKDFEPFAKQLVVPIIYKFKEKKTNITEASLQALDNFMLCVNLEQIKEDLIQTGLQDKPSSSDKSLQVTPSMKKNVCLFLEKAAQKTYIDVLQRVSADFLNALIKLSEDPDGDLRNTALQVIGIFKGRLGEAAMANYLKDMNPQKLTKVNEAAKQVQPSKYDRPEKKEAPSANLSKPNQAIKKPQVKQQKQNLEDEVALPAPKNNNNGFNMGNTKSSANADDERPLGSSKGGYNLDGLGQDAFKGTEDDSLIVMDKKPKQKPPARFAQKEVQEPNKEEVVKKSANVNMDDMPISTKQQPVDTPMADEDIPVPKGSYNLDNLPPDAFGGSDPFGNDSQPLRPTKKPPAKFANKAKPAPVTDHSNPGEDAPIKPAKVQNIDEIPLGAKSKDPMASMDDTEDKPLPRGAYNLDALGDDAFGRPPASSVPKKAPVRPAAAKKQEDEEMKDETEVVAPPKKAPPAKPAPSKAKEESKIPAKTAGGPKAPQIQEDNVGEGLSKEEAIAKVEETFSPEAVANLADDKKWNEKVEGFKQINQSLPEMQPDAIIIEALVKYTKLKLKDWKESNINLIKESISLFTTISTQCEKMSKRAVFVMMPFLSDKLGDVKLLNSVSELLLSLSETVTPKYVALQLLKYGSQAKAPNVIKETCNILSRLTDEFGFSCMPVKEMIDFAIVSVNNSNPQVRTASMALFAMLYKHAGEAVKNFIKDVKESTMKLIEEEFNKVTPYAKGEFQRKRNFKGEAAFEEKANAGGPGKKGAAGGGGGLDDILPRADISKQLTPKLMPLFGDNDWKKRKEAADKVEEILKAANMRIQPVGLNELMDKIKQRMTDANKAVCKAYIQLICLLVEALGPNAKQFAKKILPPMMQNLADKQSLVRADTVTAMDKWAKECGAELIISIGCPMVSQDNPELRTEMLGWVIRNKDSIKEVSPDSLKECCKPLVECLSDKTPAIRSSTEEVIMAVMPFTGYAAFQAVMSNLKPAVQQSIKPILEKVKAKVGDIAPASSAQQQQLTQSIDGVAQMKTAPQQQTSVPQGPTLKPQVSGQVQGLQKPQIKPKETLEVPQQQSTANDPKMNQTLNSSVSQKQLLQTPSQNKFGLQKAQQQQAQQQTGPRLKAHLTQSVSNFKPSEAAQDFNMSQQSDSLAINHGQKDKRAELDRRTKFHVEEMKGDQIDRLKNQTISAFGEAFQKKLFSQDFKLHCECIDSFSNVMQNQPEAILEVLDLIFKWTAVRLADNSNTQFIVRVFDFFASLFNHLTQLQYQLQDFEAAVLVPLLCEKSGLNNNILKEKAKKLLRMAFDVCETQLCYNYLISSGLNSKNLVAIAQCLDELAEFVNRNGIDFSSQKELKQVAKLVDSPAKDVRENALKVLGEIYKHLDDNIWSQLGDINPKVNSLIEARFKKIKGGPSLNTLYASASVANFNTARPQTAMQNDPMGSSLGLKQHNPQQQAKAGAKLGMKQPSLVSARNNLGPQRQSVGAKLTNSIPYSQNQEEVQKQMSQMTLEQPSPQDAVMEDVQPQSSLASKLKPLNQPTRQQVVPPTKQVQEIPQPPVIINQPDDDEDLRMFANEIGGLSLEQQKVQKDLEKIIHTIKYADISKKIDGISLMNSLIHSLNDQTLVAVQMYANELILAIAFSMNEAFEVPLEQLNLKFIKFFMQTVLKICSLGHIMRHLGYDALFALSEQLLTRLLIEGLGEQGDKQEAELTIKSLNSSILRILENCNHTYVMCSLFDLLTKYHDSDQQPRLPNIVGKCLLKLSKIIDKLVSQLDVGMILLSVHKYMLVINHERKTQNDEMGIRTAKTILNELIKIKREAIWEDYATIKQHPHPDNHIIKWIQVVLKSLQTQGAGPSSDIYQMTAQQDQSAFQKPQQLQRDEELLAILNELKAVDKFDANLPRLYQYLHAYPDIDLDGHMINFSNQFKMFVKKRLDEYTRRMTQINQPQEVVEHEQQKQNINQNYYREVHDFQDESQMRWTQVQGATQSNTSMLPQGGYQGMRQSMPTTQSVPQTQNIPGIIPPGNQTQNNLERLQQMKQRMAMMKKKDDGAGTSNSDQTQNKQQDVTGNPSGGGGLNTSFSAMNNNLSMKWQAKKNQIQNVKAGGTDQTQALATQQQTYAGGYYDPSQQQQIAGVIEPNHGGQMYNSNGLQVQQPLSQIPGAKPQQSDLNNRLAEMKAKLAALKSQK